MKRNKKITLMLTLVLAATLVIYSVKTVTHFGRGIASTPLYPWKLHPFTSDGCSMFPDSDFFYNWLECCVEHDVAYWKGGTEVERKDADLALAACVRQKANFVLSETMYQGVRVGGSPDTFASWRWGYGWIERRGAGKLSAEDLAEVARYGNVRDLPLHLISSPELYSSTLKTGPDYCAEATKKRLVETYPQTAATDYWIIPIEPENPLSANRLLVFHPNTPRGYIIAEANSGHSGVDCFNHLEVRRNPVVIKLTEEGDLTPLKQ